MRNFYLKFIGYVLSIFFLIGCTFNKEKQKEIMPVRDDQSHYFETTPDAPLDFYCQLNDIIENYTRAQICNIVSDSIKSLSADLLITIVDNKVDTIEMVVFSFKKTRVREISDEDYSSLNKSINSVDLSTIITMNKLENATYLCRLQLERFCNGYAEFVEIGTNTAQKAVQKSIEK